MRLGAAGLRPDRPRPPGVQKTARGAAGWGVAGGGPWTCKPAQTPPRTQLARPQTAQLDPNREDGSRADVPPPQIHHLRDNGSAFRKSLGSNRGEELPSWNSVSKWSNKTKQKYQQRSHLLVPLVASEKEGQFLPTLRYNSFTVEPAKKKKKKKSQDSHLDCLQF